VLCDRQDEGFGRLTAKLEAALATTAFQDDSVVKQFSNCSQRRRNAKERRMEAAKARRSESTTASNPSAAAAAGGEGA
jgi:hypothetical protein